MCGTLKYAYDLYIQYKSTYAWVCFIHEHILQKCTRFTYVKHPTPFGFSANSRGDQWWSWYTRLITEEFLSSFSDSCLSSVTRAKVYFHELVSSCSGFTLDDPPCKNASASIGGLQYRMRKTHHLSTFNISLSQLWQPWYFTSLTWTQ